MRVNIVCLSKSLFLEDVNKYLRDADIDVGDAVNEVMPHESLVEMFTEFKKDVLFLLVFQAVSFSQYHQPELITPNNNPCLKVNLNSCLI